jgi:urease accessory protein
VPLICKYILTEFCDTIIGGFVASSGLECYNSHGLLRQGAAGLLQFIRLSLETYSNTSAAFLLDTHYLVTRHVTNIDDNEDISSSGTATQRREALLASIFQLDQHYHSMNLNHVAQRASKAQGIALLTLFTNSFSQQQSPNDSPISESKLNGPECSRIIRDLKSAIRADSLHGHLPICWAAFTACLGISAKRSLQVHLFLQVRAIISSAIRLNIVGPYLAHRLLAFNAREIIHENLRTVSKSKTEMIIEPSIVPKEEVIDDEDEEGGWKWTWPQDGSGVIAEDQHTPRMTWPLGDLVQARHDQLHSRLFNS